MGPRVVEIRHAPLFSSSRALALAGNAFSSPCVVSLPWRILKEINTNVRTYVRTYRHLRAYSRGVAWHSVLRPERIMVYKLQRFRNIRRCIFLGVMHIYTAVWITRLTTATLPRSVLPPPLPPRLRVIIIAENSRGDPLAEFGTFNAGVRCGTSRLESLVFFSRLWLTLFSYRRDISVSWKVELIDCTLSKFCDFAPSFFTSLILFLIWLFYF